MNILLTGFSGTLGTAVAKSLLEAGHQLRVLHHGAVIDPQELDSRIEIVWGGLAHHRLFDQITENIDVVVHCAWDGRGAFNGTLEKVNLYATTSLIESAERNGVKTFIHISSVGVYGLSRSLWGKVLDENQPLVSKEESLHPYPWVKVLIEKKCEEIRTRLNTNLVILRPGLLFSDTKGPAKKIVASEHKRCGIFVGRAKNHLPYIHVKDVANMISIFIDKPPRYGVFNCVPTIDMPAVQFFRKWGEHYGYSVKTLRLPPAVFRLMNWGVQLLKSALGRKSGNPNVQYQILTGIRDIRYSADKAVRELGWQDTVTRSIALTGSS